MLVVWHVSPLLFTIGFGHRLSRRAGVASAVEDCIFLNPALVLIIIVSDVEFSAAALSGEDGCPGVHS